MAVISDQTLNYDLFILVLRSLSLTTISSTYIATQVVGIAKATSVGVC